MLRAHASAAAAMLNLRMSKLAGASMSGLPDIELENAQVG
jgi:hypothetical protein